MILGIIYKATSPSGKIYVGKTIQCLEDRKYQHFYLTKKAAGTKFHNALIKYGSDAFVWEILYDNVPEDQLNNMERWTIANYDTYACGYNSTLGGDGVIGNHKPKSEEHKRKIGEANKGRKCPWMIERNKMFVGVKLDDERKKEISRLLMGRPCSEKTREKMSIAAKGKPKSEESKMKNRIAHIGLSAGEKNCSALLTWDKAREIRSKYNTGNYFQRELAEEYGVSRSTICDIIDNRSWRE